MIYTKEFKKSENIIPVSLASFRLVFLFDVLFGSVIYVVRKIEISFKQEFLSPHE